MLCQLSSYGLWKFENHDQLVAASVAEHKILPYVEKNTSRAFCMEEWPGS
jgi:DICT domain-containing protein